MRFWTLVQAQLWEMRRNPMIMMAPMLIIVMAGIFSLAPKEPELAGFFPGTVLMMAPFMVGWQIPSISMAEEKEKRTLEALMLTPARPLEIILAKAFWAVIFSLVAGLTGALFFREMPQSPGLIVGTYFLALLFAVSGGTLIGLLLPDTKTVGSVGTMLVLAITFSGFPIFEMVAPAVWDVVAWLPSRPLYELFRSGWTGREVPMAQYFGVVLVYSVLALGLCVRAFRRMATAR